MKRRLKEPFGKAGLIVGVIALVFAMLGGAYAATNSGGGKATASAKQGKQGKQGKPGKPGPAGPQGPAGPAGAAGAKGDTGGAGNNGTNGVSVTGTEFSGAKEGHCASPNRGGVEFVGANKTFACNGKEGSPWTAGGTLPKGSSETGTFAVNQVAQKLTLLGGRYLPIPISFPIPLGAEIELEHIHLIKSDETLGEEFESPVIASEECSGTIASPGAAEGNLCIFLGVESRESADFAGESIPAVHPSDPNNPGSSTRLRLEFPHATALWPNLAALGASKAGTMLIVPPKKPSTEEPTQEEIEAAEVAPIFLSGSWAVTAE